MVRKIFLFFIYSNLFITCCAVAMVAQTYSLVLLEPVNTDFLFFLIFSTICSYSFHWYLTGESVIPSSRIGWLKKNRFVHLILFIAGLAGAGIYFFKLIEWWPWLLVSAIVTFLYSAPKIPHPLFRSLRKIALGKTIFLAFVWMHVTTLLPMILSGQSWKPDFTLFIISRFFLVYAICILFDYRDRPDDKASGVRSLITYLNEKGINNLFIFSIVTFFISTIGLALYNYTIPAILLLILPGILTAVLFPIAKKNFSDIIFYFLLDGLMALSAFIMLIPGNWLTLRTQ